MNTFSLMQSRPDEGTFCIVTVVYDDEERDQLDINVS